MAGIDPWHPYPGIAGTAPRMAPGYVPPDEYAGSAANTPKGMSLDQLDLIKKSLGPAAPAPTYASADLSEKHRLNFARAKDTQGELARASLTGLREDLASRGMLGSGVERQGSRMLHQKVAGNLSNTVTQQASEQSALDQHAADQNFAAQQAAAARQQQMTQSLTSLIQSAGGLYDPAKTPVPGQGGGSYGDPSRFAKPRTPWQPVGAIDYTPQFGNQNLPENHWSLQPNKQRY